MNRSPDGVADVDRTGSPKLDQDRHRLPEPIGQMGVDCAEAVAALAHAALIGELETWPKPGLVSPKDSGSHRDMDATTLRRSAAAIHPFFAELAVAGGQGAALVDLRAIGLRAEAAMLSATGGVNAHRGAIFSLGLICAAAGAAGGGPVSAERRAASVDQLWGEALMRAPVSPVSHGGRASRRYGVGGASAEAGRGFPTIRTVALPALRYGRRLAPAQPDAARVQCFFALLAVVDDTNLLHRGGAAGLAAARGAADAFLAVGGVAAPDWLDRAIAIHRDFVAARLSPGGCADLLAATLLLDALGAGAGPDSLAPTEDGSAASQQAPAIPTSAAVAPPAPASS